MKATIGILGVFSILLGFEPQNALADPPPPSFDLYFSDNAAIWSPFEDFLACETELGTTLCLELFNVVCDGRGSCTGDGELSLSGNLDGLFTGPVTAKSRCTRREEQGTRPVCQAKFKIEAEGSLTDGLTTCTGSIIMAVNGPVDLGGFYDGKARGRLDLVCAGRRARESLTGLFQYTVNPPTPWSLNVQVSQDGRKLEGTATDSLGFSYTAKGNYSDRNDESRITLKGETDSASKGAKVMLKDLTTTGPSVTGGTAKISVQGNRSTAEIGP